MIYSVLYIHTKYVEYVTKDFIYIYTYNKYSFKKFIKILYSYMKNVLYSIINIHMFK